MIGTRPGNRHLSPFPSLARHKSYKIRAKQPRNTSMSAVLVPVRLEGVQRQDKLLAYAVETAKSRVFLYLTGRLAASDPTPELLDQLAHCFELVGRLKPRLDLVPLFPCVGWDPEQLAELPGVEEMVAGADHLHDCHALLDKINASRERLQLPSLSLTLSAGGSGSGSSTPAPADGPAQVSGDAGAGGQLQQQQQDPAEPAQQAQQQGQQQQGAAPALHSRVIGDWRGPLRFAKVAMGGTFDRLHAGHRLLLAATALVSTSEIFVGITAQKLLQNKRNRELLESYDFRAAAAADYILAVNPAVQVFTGPLNDPNEPPPAATDPGFQAIVVSQETIPGAEAINVTRAELGFQPLVIVVVGLVAPQPGAEKLSSTDLRAQDAERAALP